MRGGGAGGRWQGAGSREQGAGGREQGAGGREQGEIDLLSTNLKFPTVISFSISISSRSCV